MELGNDIDFTVLEYVKNHWFYIFKVGFMVCELYLNSKYFFF